MDYMLWRFESLFSRFVGVRLGKSFQRTCLGHYGRHISDYSTARLTLEAAKTASFDEALATTFNVLSYNCLPIAATTTWFDDSMREAVDGQLIVVHQVLTSMLDIPCLSLPFLCKALLPYESLSPQDQIYVDTHPDAKTLAAWVKDLIDNQCFVYEQEIRSSGGDRPQAGSDVTPIRVERGEKMFHPYITTSATASEDMSYLRCKTRNRGLSEEIARKFVKHPELMTYSRNTGFTVDERVVKCMLDRCGHINLGLENAFGSHELCNPSTIFSLARRQLGDCIVSPISESVMQKANFVDPQYLLTHSDVVGEMQEVTFGVNLSLAVILSSMIDGSATANAQVDERLSRSLMYLMLRDVPKQFLGQGGDTYLRKNFRGNCPVVDMHKLEGFNDPQPAYFVRPEHDHQKGVGGVTLLSCTVYHNYAPEDLAHLGELTALSDHYSCKSVLDISLTYATPRYMFMYDTMYPIAMTNEGISVETKRLGHAFSERVRGYLIVRKENNGTTPWKIRYFGAHSVQHNTQGDDVWDIDEALATRHTVVLPLIKRHNAVVYNEETNTFGVVLPQETNVQERKFHEDTYFNNDPAVWGYSVLFENSTAPVTINVLQLEQMLIPIAQPVYIRLDVYLNYRTQNTRHIGNPTSRSNQTIDAMVSQYIKAVVSYPSSYPSTVEQTSSMFVEIGYTGKGSDSDTYVPMEINLASLLDSGFYAKHENPPLSTIDPRISYGHENVSVLSFSGAGFK